MQKAAGFRSAYHILKSRGLLRQVPLFLGLGMATILEGIGLATFIPILLLAEDAASATPSSFASWATSAFATVGLNQPSMASLIGVFMICVFCKSLLMMICLSVAGLETAGFVTKLRYLLLKKIMHARWAFFTQQSIAQLNHAIVTETKFAGRAYRAALRVFTRLASASVYIVLAFLVNPLVALFSLIAALAIGWTVFRVSILSRAAQREYARSTSDLVALLSDVLTNLKPVRAMERTSNFAHRLIGDVNRMQQVARKFALTEQTGGELSDLLLTLFMAAGFYVAIGVVQMHVAEILVLCILVQRLATSISRINLGLITLEATDQMYWQVRELVGRLEEEKEDQFGDEVPVLSQSIEFSHVCFGYNTADVLYDITLTIPSGSITAITGESGAGKTTMIDLLLGLHRPRSGNILVDGVDLSDIDISLWREMIGYVPQEMLLFNDSILQNITLGDQRLSTEQAWRALERAGATQFVRALPEGLLTKVGERGTMLSGGQRQRLSIARAIITEPKLLILDEATSALDPETERDIVSAIRYLRGEMTILAVTHQPAWSSIADQVIQLSAGRLLSWRKPIDPNSRSLSQAVS